MANGMEMMVMNMLKQSGLDPEKIKEAAIAVVNKVNGLDAKLDRIEKMLAKLMEINEIQDRNNKDIIILLRQYCSSTVPAGDDGLMSLKNNYIAINPKPFQTDWFEVIEITAGKVVFAGYGTRDEVLNRFFTGIHITGDQTY